MEPPPWRSALCSAQCVGGTWPGGGGVTHQVLYRTTEISTEEEGLSPRFPVMRFLPGSYQGRPAAPPISMGTEGWLCTVLSPAQLTHIDSWRAGRKESGGKARKMERKALQGSEEGGPHSWGKGHLLPSVSSEGRSTPSFLSSTGGSWEGMTESCKKMMVLE